MKLLVLVPVMNSTEYCVDLVISQGQLSGETYHAGLADIFLTVWRSFLYDISVKWTIKSLTVKVGYTGYT